MANDLMRRPHADLVINRTRRDLEQYRDDPQVKDIHRRGHQHQEAQRVMAMKARAAVEDIRDLHGHAQQELDQFTRTAWAVRDAAGRAADDQEVFDAITDDLVSSCRGQIGAVLNTTGYNIASLAAEDVLIPLPEKKEVVVTMNELSLIFTGDPRSYATYLHDITVMHITTEVAKVSITVIARQYERRVKQAVQELGRRPINRSERNTP